MSGTRVISQSEIATVLECPARWGFGYGKLAGFPIEPKVSPTRLREGTAWGRAVATFHTLVTEMGRERAGQRGVAELVASLDRDAQRAMDEGVYDNEEHTEILDKLVPLFSYYAVTTRPMRLISTEQPVTYELGGGWSYAGSIDGVHEDDEGGLWIVEFKLRERMTPLEQVVLWRQIRWYALAFNQNHLAKVRGVLVDEAHNTKLNPVAFNKDGSVSARQSCTLEEYQAACREARTIPNLRTVDMLAKKVWHQRHEIIIREDEYADAAAELASAARLAYFYDSGQLLPLRHPGPSRCPGCSFKSICPTPEDTRLRDALYRPNTYQPATPAAA